MSKAASRGSVRRMTGLSLLTAIIAVLTVLGNFVRFGPFPITLALAPIIIGAAMYGPSAGAILGGGVRPCHASQRPCRLGRRHGDIPDGRAACGMHPCVRAQGRGRRVACRACLSSCRAEKRPCGCDSCRYSMSGREHRAFIAGMLLFFTSTLESWASGQARAVLRDIRADGCELSCGAGRQPRARIRDNADNKIHRRQEKQMILAVDVGNTNIVLGCIEDGEILNIVRIQDQRHTDGG